MGYWREIAGTAAKQALKDVKLDSLVLAIIIVLAHALIALGIFVGFGHYTEATAFTRALAALTPFLSFPVAFVIRAMLLPHSQDRKLREAIEILKNPPAPERYDDGLYQYGALVGIVSNPSVTTNQVEFGAVENSDGLQRQEAFFYQARLLILSEFAGYAGTQTVMTIAADGKQKSETRNAVMTGVRCHIIGSADTVKRQIA